MKKMMMGLMLTMASSTAFGASMSCYVDTPALDQFTSGFCGASVFNGPRTTSAVFRIDNAPSNINTIIWSDSACSSSSTVCITSIQAYGPKTVTATILKTDGTYEQASAHAEYELGF